MHVFSASIIPVQNSAEPAGAQLAYFTLSTHTEMSRAQTQSRGRASQWTSPSFCFAAGTQCSARWLGWMGKVPERWDHLYSGGGVMHRAGSITDFNNWRLTFSKTPLITLETNHMESTQYIAYLHITETHWMQQLSGCLCLDELATDFEGASASSPWPWVHQREPPGMAFRALATRSDLIRLHHVLIVSMLNKFWPLR